MSDFQPVVIVSWVTLEDNDQRSERHCLESICCQRCKRNLGEVLHMCKQYIFNLILKQKEMEVLLVYYKELSLEIFYFVLHVEDINTSNL